jgi:hypothetical protein
MATTTFNDLITFSRGSNATVTGPNGLIQWAPSNIVTSSQDFEAASWAKNSSTITANSAVAPDGTQTADTWTPTSTATTAGVRLLGSFSVTSGSIQTASIYVKSAGKRWFFMTTPSASSDNDNCWFDLQNGVVGTIGSSALSATMTAVGNGWFRITTTSIAASATNYIFISATTGNNTTAVTADGTGVYIWGAQLELGSTATTYNNTSVRNLLGFSEAFDNAAWQKLSASIVTGAQANPVNGLFNAQKLMEDTSTGIHRTFQTATLVVAPYTFSFYAKPAGRDWLYINVSGAAHTAFVNIATGAVGATVGSPTVTMTPLSGGWYRVAMTYSNASAGASNQQIWLASNSTTTSYTGDGNSGVYIYGAQLSNSASLDPYVPTPGAAPSSTAYYGPRFDYDPVTLAARGLLIEEQRTNEITRSSEFSTWSVVNASVTSDTTVAPDGTTTADTFTSTTTSGYVSKAGTTTSKTISIYAKALIGRYFGVSTNGASAADSANFDLQTATVVSTGANNVSASITLVGNGWYRLVVTRGATAGTDYYFGTFGSTGAAGNSFAIWGAQLEAGAFATSYIPTIASTVTRSADVAVITGSLFSQWYNQPAGAFVVDADSYTVSTTDFVLTASDGTPNNRFGFYRSSANIGGYVVTGNVTQMDFVRSPVTANTPYRAAVAATLNDGNMALNGSLAAGDTSITMPTLDRLGIGNNNSSGFISGHIRSIRYVPVRAADFQLQELTAQSIVDYTFLQTASGDQLVDGNGDYLYSIPIFG